MASGTAADTAVHSGQLGPADITLAGGLSPYGTMGQGGNVGEWEETDSDLLNDSVLSPRGYRGGDFSNGAFPISSSWRSISVGAPASDVYWRGFRVASTIPEALPGDFDLDGDVDGEDFLLWQLGRSPTPFSPLDLTDWEANYGMVAQLSATSTAVPEPNMLLLGAMASIGLMLRRKV